MSELISGKEALIALANGEDVQQWNGSIFWDIDKNWQVSVFFQEGRKFRLKPRTITINGIEVPKPNKPESCYSSNGSVVIVMDDNDKAVELCLALREVFK